MSQVVDGVEDLRKAVRETLRQGADLPALPDAPERAYLSETVGAEWAQSRVWPARPGRSTAWPGPARPGTARVFIKAP